MDVDALIDQVAEHGERLAVAAEKAGLDAPVAGTEWDVRSLVTHTGGVHRWAADIVRARRDSPDTEAGRAVGTGPGDGELLPWFREGHAALVQALREAPADLQCFTFLPADSPRHFWARRQAHETAIHRADAEAAAGSSGAFEPGFAQDGIAEILLGFGGRRPRNPPAPATLGLAATDGPSWQVRLGERIAATPTALGETDATVRGSSADLYLWLWNRPSAASVEGDAAVARSWGETVRVRWS